MKRQEWTVAGLLGTLVLSLGGCAEGYTQESYTLTGLYGPGFAYYDDGYGGWGWTGNFDIFVGIPFEAYATLKCFDSAGNRPGDASFAVSIVSGELPPGLEVVSHDTIAGVPTRAGTWHLRVAFDNLYCAGNYYETRYQDLTIKTSGN